MMFLRRRKSLILKDQEYDPDGPVSGSMPKLEEVTFTDENGDRYKFKVKKGRMKITCNKKKISLPKSMSMNSLTHELLCGGKVISLSDSKSSIKILPDLAKLCQDAGIPGLDNYLNDTHSKGIEDIEMKSQPLKSPSFVRSKSPSRGLKSPSENKARLANGKKKPQRKRNTLPLKKKETKDVVDNKRSQSHQRIAVADTLQDADDIFGVLAKKRQSETESEIKEDPVGSKSPVSQPNIEIEDDDELEATSRDIGKSDIPVERKPTKLLPELFADPQKKAAAKRGIRRSTEEIMTMLEEEEQRKSMKKQIAYQQHLAAQQIAMAQHYVQHQEALAAAAAVQAYGMNPFEELERQNTQDHSRRTPFDQTPFG
ncbi:hypothetical protein AAMO2058_000281300 [Amorphochlora amoebiformis]